VPARNAAAPERRVFLLLGLALSLGVRRSRSPRRSADGSFHTPRISAHSARCTPGEIPLIGGSGANRKRLWLMAGPIAIGLVLVVLASYHIASGNDQLAFLF
jgi:hypothetical protein